jgi:hypothetical protein
LIVCRAIHGKVDCAATAMAAAVKPCALVARSDAKQPGIPIEASQ